MNDRADFLNKLADLMDEYGVESIDAMVTDHDGNSAVDFCFVEGMDIETDITYVAADDLRKISKSYE